MISSLKKFKQICFGVSKVGDQKQKLQMLPWSMLLDKTKPKPLPKLLTDDYFFFRCIINIIYINEVNRSNATANRKRWKKRKTTKKLVKLQLKKNLSFMYDDFESGAWHDKNNTIHNLEKKNDFDTSDKNKNIENKKPTSYIALPTIKKVPAHIPWWLIYW